MFAHLNVKAPNQGKTTTTTIKVIQKTKPNIKHSHVKQNNRKIEVKRAP